MLLQASEDMVRFQLRHGNDLLAMDSLRDCDVSVQCSMKKRAVREEIRLSRLLLYLLFQEI